MSQPLRHAETVMGTVVSFDVRPAGSSDVQEYETRLPSEFRTGARDEGSVQGSCRTEPSDAIAAACRSLHDADSVFSPWIADSAVSRLRRGDAHLADLPDDVGVVWDLCEQALDLSRGWFDAWALPGGFDPTGLVKGWAVARALELLRSAGIASACVNGGGDLAVFGHPELGRPWRIGIANPFDTSTLACEVEVSGAIATSGTYERGAHIIAPLDRGPAPIDLVSASVTGPDLVLAEVYATALMAGGLELLDAMEAAGYAALLVESTGSIRATASFPIVVDDGGTYGSG